MITHSIGPPLTTSPFVRAGDQAADAFGVRVLRVWGRGGLRSL